MKNEHSLERTGLNIPLWFSVAGAALLLTWPYLMAVEPNVWRRLATLAVLVALGAYGWAMVWCRQQEYEERQRERQSSNRDWSAAQG